MGALRQVALVIALLLGLSIAAAGGFYLLGPLLQGPALSTPVAGGDLAEVTITPSPGLMPRGAPTRTPYIPAAPTPSPPPTPIATPSPMAPLAPRASPTPSTAPTRGSASVATATQTQAATDSEASGAAPHILVAPASLALTEPEGSALFTIRLGSQPVAAVTIPLSTSNDQCSVSPGEVTLDRDNWRDGARVTVLAADDTVADGEQACLVQTGPASSSGADYDRMTGDGVTVTVADDETVTVADDETVTVADNETVTVAENEIAGIEIAPSGLTISEPEGTGTLTIALGSQPVAAVTIPLRTSNEQCSVSPGEVTLDRDNWRDGASVTVMAADDPVADGEQACLVQTGPASSSGVDYDQMTPDDVTVRVADDEIAGIEIAPTGLTISEPEGTGTLTIALGSQPVAAVTIPLSTSNDQCSVSPGEVTLDRDNWSDGARVTVLAADDAVADGEQACLVQTGPASSSGADYDQMTPDDLTVTVADDETAGIVIVPTGLMISEPEGTGTLTIALGSQPVAAVTIPLSTSNDQCSVSPGEVTLNRDNWRGGASVTVLAADDTVADGEQACLIKTGPASSSGVDYDQMTPDDVTVRVADDETAGIVIAPTGLTISEPEGSGTLTIALSSEPISPVVVSFSSDKQTRVSPPLVTFTERNWSEEQAVVVVAVDDDVAEGKHSSSVRYTVDTSDAGYARLAGGSVTAEITDDDTTGVVVVPTELQILEGGTPQTYQVVLASQPTAPITISAITDEHVLVSPVQLAFSELEWNVPQTVTVMAVDDEVALGPLTSIISHISSSDVGGYSGASISDVSARVTDNDASSEVVGPVAPTPGARPLATVQAMLARQPSETTAQTTEEEEPADATMRRIRVSPELIFVVILAITAGIIEFGYARAPKDTH